MAAVEEIKRLGKNIEDVFPSLRGSEWKLTVKKLGLLLHDTC